MFDEMDPREYEEIWPSDAAFEQWVEEHSAWVREQELIRVNVELRALAAEMEV